MRILILSCNTGGGHNSCGKALLESFRACGVPCEMDDALRFLSPKLSRCVSYGFDRIYRYTPRLFAAGYRFSERNPRVLRKRSAAQRMLSLGARKLKRLILREDYDAVICTHIFASMLASAVRDRYGIPLRIGFVATDYTCHPGTADCGAEAFFIPHAALTAEFVEKGVPAERIIPCGIPVRSGFYCGESPTEARRKLGISPQRRHLMIMGGSMGCGPIREVAELLAERLPEDCRVSVICGSNRSLEEDLREACGDHPRIRIYGFTDKISLLMDSADLCLTKPGGITVTEAAHKGLPMVLVNAVAGCETPNLQFFTALGAAETAKTPQELADVCLRLLNDPAALAEMSAALETVAVLRPEETVLNWLQPAAERSSV